MHVEKNVCEDVICTIGDEKDGKEVRRDLKARNIWLNLWLMGNPKNRT
jgi:hypothetical protein